MEYNTLRNDLKIREYGRNIQKMINYVQNVEDRDTRSKLCQTIIKAMALVSPLNKEIEDYKHKLWDHLYIMSDLKLDVDSPYPKPEGDFFESKPQKIEYPKNHIKLRPYGRIIETMIAKASKMDEGAEKQAFVQTIANHLKKQYINWNRDSVSNDLIIQHLELLSDGKLKLDEEFKFVKTNDIIYHSKQAPANVDKKQNFKKRSNNPPSNYRYSNNRNRKN